MLPSVLLLVAPFAPPAPAPRMVAEEVELTTPTGVLHGEFDLPPVPGPWPVVLIHPGSGPTDRDGNSRLGAETLRNDSLKLLGRALASHGITALRIDKRGIAASKAALGDVLALRPETYGDDAAAWLHFLRKDPRFTRVGVIGHSEGALMAILAAGKEKVDAMVCLCGLGRPLQDVLRAQLKRSLNGDLLKKANKIIDELEAGRPVPQKEIPTELMTLFRPNVQPYIIAEFKLDPAALLAKLEIPTLIVNGTTDLQVPVEDGKRLAAARKDCKHIVLDRMNHVLKETDKTTVLEQLSIYSDPSLPLHPKLVDELARFMKDPRAQ